MRETGESVADEVSNVVPRGKMVWSRQLAVIKAEPFKMVRGLSRWFVGSNADASGNQRVLGTA